jgi:hypothetical protein
VRLDLPHQCVDPGYHSAFPDVLGHCEGESGETKWTKDKKKCNFSNLECGQRISSVDDVWAQISPSGSVLKVSPARGTQRAVGPTSLVWGFSLGLRKP